MPESAIVKVISVYYGIVGVIALVVGVTIAASGLSLPLLFSASMLGIVGIALSTLFAVPAFILAAITILLASGLWHEREWALYISVGLSAIGLVLTGLAWLVISSFTSLPIVSAMFQLPIWDFLVPIALNAIILLGLLTNRSDFS